MVFTAIVPLIDGFEEIEALAVVDILRRVEIEVFTAGVEQLMVTSSHKVQVAADRLLADIAGREFDLVVLPGGPGTPNLGRNEVVRRLVTRHAEKGKWIAAICAAPSILAELGLLMGKTAACHPTVESKMLGARLVYDPVAVDGQFITSRGAGTAIDFALTIVEQTLGPETARKVAAKICLPDSSSQTKDSAP